MEQSIVSMFNTLTCFRGVNSMAKNLFYNFKPHSSNVY